MAFHFPSKIGPKLATLLGIVYLLFIILVALITLPLYLYRIFVKVLAKWCRSSDLCEMVSDQSAVFLGDYFISTTPATGGTSRSNVVLIMTFQGHLAWHVVKERVMNNWIRDRGKNRGVEGGEYDKLQQYPVQWLGYTFWKKGMDTFKVENHVHQLAGEDTVMSEEKLENTAEKLLNVPFPKNQSPWGLYLIENYVAGESGIEDDSIESSRKSVLIFKIHHCLSDWIGIMRCLVNGLFGDPLEIVTRPQSPSPTYQPLWKTCWYRITFPGRALLELIQIFSHHFLDNPWKVSDANKKWRQVYAKSGPVPIQLIKDIKNWFGVSFTEILLSTVASAVHQRITQQDLERPLTSLLCRCSLPTQGVEPQNVFKNQSTAAIYDLPVKNFASPGERLQTVHRTLLRSRKSVIPVVTQYWSAFLGAQLFPLCRVLANNKGIPINFSNFVGPPVNISMDDGKSSWIQTEVVLGGLSGEASVSIGVLSHGPEIRIQLAVEEALMTREQAQQFVTTVLDEIGLLWEEMLENPFITLSQ